MAFLTQLFIKTVMQVGTTFLHNWPFLLVSVLVAVALKLYLDPQKVSAFLIRYRKAGVVGATVAAVTTPLCSCGTTAIILGMMAGMMPWAPIVAFMVASPLTSPEELVYSAGLFGWPFALTFFIASIALGLLGGLAAGLAENRGWLANQARIGVGSEKARSRRAQPALGIAMPALPRLVFAAETAPATCGCGSAAAPQPALSVVTSTVSCGCGASTSDANTASSREPIPGTGGSCACQPEAEPVVKSSACGCGSVAAEPSPVVTPAPAACGCGTPAVTTAPAVCGCGSATDKAAPEAAVPATCGCGSAAEPAEPVKARVTLQRFLSEAVTTGQRLLVMFLGFAFIGYFLNGLIPQAWVSAVFGSGNVYSVPLAATLGLPLYINTEASLPLVRALIDGGMSQGAALAFLITGAGTSIGALAGALTIARWRVIGLVIGTLWVGAVATGFIYDMLLAAGLV